MNYSLTNPQNSIWLTEKFYNNTSINNISGSAYIDEIIDFEALKHAINEVIKTNDAMRIKIKEEGNSCIQYISPYTTFDIEIIELASKEDVEKKALELAKIPFSIEDNLLFKFTLYKLPNNYGGFFLSVHHLIGDSWSLGLVVKQVMATYSDIKNNNYIEKSYPSYTSYIEAEKKYLESDKFKKDKEYWNEVFKTVPEIATIPSCQKQNDVSCNGNRINFSFSKDLVNTLNNFCRENKITLYNFFMAIYSLYLGRVSNLDDFVIGTPILNRTNFEQKNTMGMFISTAPLRVNLKHEIPFIDFIKNISTNTISLFRHQKYPYQYILEDLRKIDSSVPNLYSVILSYQITKTFDEESGIKYRVEWINNGCCADDLQIHLLDLNDDEEIHIAYDYKTDKYTSQDIADLHERILTIINQVMSNNAILLKDIEIVTPEEKYKILYDFNNPKVDYPKDKTIVDLFEEQVEKTPDNIAVVFEDQELTYKELNEKANQLARYLTKNGIKPHSVIGLRLNKSLEMIISILAIIKAGCCYLPINMSYPEDRVNYMLEDSNCKFLLSSISCTDMSFNVNIINVDLSNYKIYSGNTENLNIKISPEDLIYIIYTSGSTGKPKGAMLCHKNVVRLMKNDHYLFDFTDKDIWTMFHSVAFDFSVWEMYGALLYGGKLILVPDAVAKNPSEFLDLLKIQKVTVLNQTPSYFYNLQDIEVSKSTNDLSVRYVIFGGEALNPSLIKPWHKKYPKTHLINMYGITETTVHVTFKELVGENFNSSSSNIGRAIPTLKTYILDKNLNLQPFNTIGQLCVAGDGVCLGYLNRPDLNKIKFIDNPYIKGEKLYLSGDNGFLSKSGDLFYNGRIDNQFKLRGFRIEIDEIESKILSYPDVSKCVVLPKKIDNKDTQLIAYVVGNCNLNIPDLKKYVLNLLPTYMIPSFFIKLDYIPLTINGKADRKKLLTIEPQLEDNFVTYSAPRNKFEKDFIKIIEDCLNISNIGIDHNILDIGTDSLTLMKISVELLKRHYSINIQDFYEYKTIRNISDKNFENKNLVRSIEGSNIIDKLSFSEDFEKAERTTSNILLTGSTGFLGAHLLYDLIKNTNYTVYCLVRNKGNISAKDRFLSKLKYYFSNELNNYIDKRIKLVVGDITSPNLGLTDNNYLNLQEKIDTVMHSAALVSHYGSSSTFKKMNVQGTKNIIDFCNKNKIKLNYISTTSVAGDHVSKHPEKTFNFDEHCLYIGQNYNENIYSKTKFDAEQLIIKNIENGNIKATIYRLGNITARLSDIKFQENRNENAFLNRMISLINLGVFPESYLNRYIDFSPVDYCSRIINKISFESNSDNKIFHIFNNNVIKVSELISMLNEKNYNIKVISNDDFINYISTDNSISNELGIINDITSNQLNINNNIIIDSFFTLSYMKKLNIFWPKIDIDYILKFLKGEK